ncbi:MAG TPA: AAA family ATPase [Gemmatimonadaceae bacterium]|nr:AAA family ATPase [Gemmatimonadaceae bacterium]
MTRLPTPPAASAPSRISTIPLPLTGRARELAALSSALQDVEAGRGGTILLAGESGVGKTRLATTLAEHAGKRGFRVAIGRAYPVETGVPYAVFSDALTPVLRALEPSLLSLLTRGGVAELTHLLPALAIGEHAAPAAPRGDPAEIKARLLWNFSQFLSRFAARNPLLLVLENLHWADSASLELLHFVARQAGGDRILIIGTYNDAETRRTDPRSTLRMMEGSLANLGRARVMRLGPLDEAATIDLVAGALSADAALVKDVGSLVYQRTRGNPFFIEETLKSLAEDASQRARVIAGEAEALELPRTVRDAVLGRVGTLSEPARALADLIAVIGTRVMHRALAAVSALPEPALLAGLDELRRSRVLEEIAEDGTIVYDFSHPLFRETLYAELGLARARALHSTVAEALERFHGASAPAHADELAFHYLRADATGLAAKAVRYLRAAGRNAMAKHANREAADYLAAALELTGNDRTAAGVQGSAASLTLELTLDLARARLRLGEYDAALALWASAAAEAETCGLTSRLGTIRRSMGMASFWSGRHEEALAHYEAAIAAAVAAGQPATEARTLVAQGMCFQGLGRRDEARQAVLRALAIAERVGDPGLLARVHRALLLLFVWTGPPEEARKHGARAIELAEQSGERGVAWSAHWALAMLAGLTAHAHEVPAHLAEAQRLAEELRSPLLRVWTAEVAIEYHAGIGDWDSAVAEAERTVAMARGLGQRTLLPRVLVWLGLLHFGRGDVQRGKACVDEAWTLAGADSADTAPTADVHSIVPAHTGRAAYHLTMQEYVDAIRIGERGLAIADASGYVVWAIHRLMPVIAEAALWKSDLKRARRLGERLRRDSERLGHKLGLAWADACDALVELLHGDKHRAVERLRHVAEQLEAVPYVPDAARVRRQLARALAETGDRDGATRELRRAHEVFARLGAQPELDATREQLRQLGARPPVRTSATGVGGLTGRELEIVRLVAMRRSNKEIGKALDISARTVSTHLSNIFGKLGVASRGELADYAREEGLVAG